MQGMKWRSWGARKKPQGKNANYSNGSRMKTLRQLLRSSRPSLIVFFAWKVENFLHENFPLSLCIGIQIQEQGLSLNLYEHSFSFKCENAKLESEDL